MKIIIHQVYEEVDERVRLQVWDQVHHQVWSQAGAHVRIRHRWKVEDRVYSQVEGGVNEDILNYKYIVF